MIAQSPAETVQKAIYERLKADPVLAGMGVAVVDDTGKAVKPYIVIGDGDETPDNTHDQFGRDVTEVLDIWSARPGWTEANQILNRLVALLDHQELPLVGHRSVACRFVRSPRLRAATEPYDRHIAATFTVTTAQTQ